MIFEPSSAPEGVTFRTAREPELGQLHVVQRACLRRLAPNPYSHEQIGAWLSLLRPDSYRMPASDVQLAVSGHDVLGFAWLGCAGRLEALYVAPDHWRRGVGSALLRRVESAALARNAEPRPTELRLLASLNAVSFYERCGFVGRGPKTWAVGRDTYLDALLMTRAL